MKKLILITLFIFLVISNTVLAQDNKLPNQLQQQLNTSNQWQITLLDFYQLYQHQDLIIIDIRSQQTYQKDHIKDSLNIHLPTLPQTILENPNILPKDKPIYVICCAKDRNAYYAVLPLRMAGYQAYAVNGGGIDAWQYLKLPYLEQGQATELKPIYNTTLTELEQASLLNINPDYHMMNAGRSYGLKLKPLEQLITEETKELFVVEIIPEQQTCKVGETIKVTPSYVKHKTTLQQLLTQPWLETIKDQQIFLVGPDDKQLVLATIALRMLGYEAMFAVDE